MNRISPAMPAENMQTYRIVRPSATHWRPASCADVDCPAWRHGWTTSIDESTELGAAQARYIRRDSGRGFVESRAAHLTVFDFEPGQRCFGADEHRAPVEREPLYLVAGGDWRGNPRGVRTRAHANARDWVDDFGEHQQNLADRIAQG